MLFTSIQSGADWRCTDHVLIADYRGASNASKGHEVGNIETSKHATLIKSHPEQNYIMALLVDKLRPKTLDSLSFHPELSARLKSLVSFSNKAEKHTEN